jgi:hypothetical protein
MLARRILGLTFFIAISLGFARAEDSAKEVSTLVQNAIALSKNDFRSLEVGRGNNGLDQTVFPVSAGRIQPNHGNCEAIRRRDENVLTCWLTGYPSARAAEAFYFPSIQAGIPSSYRARSCGSHADAACRSWAAPSNDPTVSVLILRGDDGMYGARFAIYKKKD